MDRVSDAYRYTETNTETETETETKQIRKTKTKTFSSSQIAKAETVTKRRKGLWREEAPGPDVGALPIKANVAALQPGLGKPVVGRFGTHRPTISHRRRRTYQIAYGWLLLNRANVRIDRLPHEPGRTQFLQYRFEIVDHATATRVAACRFRCPTWRSHTERLSASGRSSRLSEQLGRCLDLVRCVFDPVKAHQHTTLEHRQTRRMVKLAALVTVRVQGLKQHRHGETPPSDARLQSKSRGRAVRPRSIVGVIIAVVVLLNDDVTAVMHRTVDRSGDHKVAGPVMMPAPGALAIVVKRLLAMMAAMETVSVPIDDHTVVIVVVPIMAVVMSLGLDDDAFFCGRDRRRSQAKGQCAQNDGLHFEFSKT